MQIALGLIAWIVTGATTAGIIRFVPPGRRDEWALELTVSIVAAIAAGLAATALDFGGILWIDWRSVGFALLVSLAATGLLRAARR